MPILAESMTTEITVTGENMVIRAVISRNTVKAIELATRPCFASTKVAFAGCKSESRTNIHTRDYPRSSPEAHALIGTCRAVEFADLDKHGNWQYWFGAHPRGYFVYDATGHAH